VVAKNAEQIVDVPIVGILDAIARNEWNVARTKVELQAAPDAAGVVLADPALDEGRAEYSPAERRATSAPSASALRPPR